MPREPASVVPAPNQLDFMVSPALFVWSAEVAIIRSLGTDDDRSTCLSNHLLLTLVESGEVEAGDFPVLDLVLEPSGMDESVIAVVARDARSAVAEVAAGARVRDEKGVRWIGKVAVREVSRSATAVVTTFWAERKTVRHVRHR